jgi:hypothetical protein
MMAGGSSACHFLYLLNMPTEIENQRGFTAAEKWIIWAVFCLLVGLSAYRFSVFAGLLLLSAGISLALKKEKPWLGLALFVAGALCIVFSKFLI